MAMNNSVCPTPGSSHLERTRFFPRQLVTPDDLTQDQEYFRAKMRRHNRLLHGWGVVCGAGVTTGPEDSEVTVQPGYVLGPFGDEIVIDEPVTIDLCKEGFDGNAASCGGGSDPWCGDVRIAREPGKPLYVAVKYTECQSRPVRSWASGCGCKESECEYSRIRDGFAIKVLTSLPSSYDVPPPHIEDSLTCRRQVVDCGRPCPPCPSDPWVILADVILSADCSVQNVDCLLNRRFVVSFGGYFFKCPPKPPPVTVERTLTVETNGPGTVTSQPPGIDCGDSCSATFPDGAQVVLTAQPSTHAGFVEWEGDASGASQIISITMTKDMSVTAEFISIPS